MIEALSVRSGEIAGVVGPVDSDKDITHVRGQDL